MSCIVPRIQTLSCLAAAIALAAVPALAAPRIVTDIAPVHSLVARVTAGVTSPELIIPPGVSPHHYSMRPSNAGKLAGAELVFWIGEGISPSFATALSSLSGEVTIVELMEAPDVRLRAYGESEDDDHGEERGDHEDEEKEDHDEAHHDHEHGDTDPHIWLDPANARAMVAAIAAHLSELDSKNTAVYARNAAELESELDALAQWAASMLEPVHDRGFVTAHDAYSYFISGFDLRSEGAIALGDASSPGPARIAAIREKIQDHHVSCILIEPQINPQFAHTVAEGTDARISVIDPLGATFEPGRDLYVNLIEALVKTVAACLADDAR